MSSASALDSAVKKHLDVILSKLHETGVLEQSTVILVGSLARNKQTWRSDTDFLVVTPTPIQHWRVPIDLHLHLTTRAAFLKNLNEGNDFEAWAMRFGKICADTSGWWPTVLANREGRTWPDWRIKVRHARKRQSIAREMLAYGDHQAAEEEYLMAAAHVARALLFRTGVFPLSRPEMPTQLIEVGLSEDAQVLGRLIEGTKDLEELKRLAIHIDQRLNWLENESELTQHGKQAELGRRLAKPSKT